MRRELAVIAALLAACGEPEELAPDLATPDLTSSQLPDLSAATGDLSPVLYDLLASADGAGGLRLLDDEFQVSSTLTQWSDLFPGRHDLLQIANDLLIMQPTQASMNHWFADSEGPLLYKTVAGNFVVEAAVHVGRRNDISLAPTGQFNAAGFVIRDASSSSPGNQRWLMYNIGFQDSAVARETKTTAASLSTLYLNNTPSAVTFAQLRVCRLANTFHFFYRHPGDLAWSEETYSPSTRVSGNGPNGATLNQPLRFARGDMPGQVQVGIMAGTWAAPHDARGEFDYVRFSEASSLADCTADFAF